MSTRKPRRQQQTPDDPFASDPLAGQDLGDPFAAAEDPFGQAEDDTPDPLAGVVPTGDVAADSLAELEAMRTAFAARAKRERARFVAATDSEYWLCVCFQTREQKEAYLAYLRRAGHLADDTDKYIDGVALARRQGVQLPTAEVPFVTGKADRTLSDLSLPLE